MGITGNLQLGGGGGVTDIKEAYTVANSGVAVTNGDSPYTVTDTGSVIVYVNSSGGAVTIGPNASPETDDRLKVIDVGGAAGTNIITVTGLGTIQTDLGSAEWRYSGSAWQIMEASRELFTRDAATNKITVAEANDTLVADTFQNESGSASLNDSGDFVTTGSVAAGSGQFGNAASNYTASGDEDVDGFTGAEANIEYDTASDSSWGNKPIFSDETTAETYTTGSNFVLVNNAVMTGGATAEEVVNNTGAGGSKYFDLSTTNNNGFRLDLGSSKVINRLTFNILNGTNLTMGLIVRGSNSAITGPYTEIIDTPNEPAPSGTKTVDFLGNTTSYRYIEVVSDYRFNGTVSGRWDTIQLFSISGYESTTNKITHNKCANGEPIATGSASLIDESDVAISGSGKVNVEVSTNSGSTFGSPIDYNTLKSNAVVYSPDTAGDNVRFRLQLIGGQKLKSADFPSQSAAINLSGSSMAYTVDGSEVFKVNSNGVVETVRSSPTVLTSSSNSVNTDALDGFVFTHTTTENTTLENPTNLVAGETYAWVFTQDATTPYTIAFGSIFDFSGGTAPTATAVASAVDMLVGLYDGTKIRCNFISDLQ